MSKFSQLIIQGNISVQTISSQSGIFIAERNIAVGWSSHRKFNTIFATISGRSNKIYNNLSIVYDPDFIDTPIDDRDTHIVLTKDSAGKEKVTNIHADSIHVNSISQNSSLLIGDGQITGMDSHSKINYAQGSVLGNYNQSTLNTNMNFDSDLIDATINDQDVKIAYAANKQG
ncbi:hypothetical protein [Ferviditalea candida]|uniref:Uncharacterized protein n=1 Tax=Ferviditalea candida TaxID=3108399 RepID=A0ABU5ZM51_9BACL|nr:hypothetical protein [Paenibacillaceae bacterium T2]